MAAHPNPVPKGNLIILEEQLENIKNNVHCKELTSDKFIAYGRRWQIKFESVPRSFPSLRPGGKVNPMPKYMVREEQATKCRSVINLHLINVEPDPTGPWIDQLRSQRESHYKGNLKYVGIFTIGDQSIESKPEPIESIKLDDYHTKPCEFTLRQSKLNGTELTITAEVILVKECKSCNLSYAKDREPPSDSEETDWSKRWVCDQCKFYEEMEITVQHNNHKTSDQFISLTSTILASPITWIWIALLGESPTRIFNMLVVNAVCLVLVIISFFSTAVRTSSRNSPFGISTKWRLLMMQFFQMIINLLLLYDLYDNYRRGINIAQDCHWDNFPYKSSEILDEKQVADLCNSHVDRFDPNEYEFHEDADIYIDEDLLDLEGTMAIDCDRITPDHCFLFLDLLGNSLIVYLCSIFVNVACLRTNGNADEPHNEVLNELKGKYVDIDATEDEGKTKQNMKDAMNLLKALKTAHVNAVDFGWRSAKLNCDCRKSAPLAFITQIKEHDDIVVSALLLFFSMLAFVGVCGFSSLIVHRELLYDELSVADAWTLARFVTSSVCVMAVAYFFCCTMLNVSLIYQKAFGAMKVCEHLKDMLGDDQKDQNERPTPTVQSIEAWFDLRCHVLNDVLPFFYGFTNPILSLLVLAAIICSATWTYQLLVISSGNTGRFFRAILHDNVRFLAFTFTIVLIVVTVLILNEALQPYTEQQEHIDIVCKKKTSLYFYYKKTCIDTFELAAKRASVNDLISRANAQAAAQPLSPVVAAALDEEKKTKERLARPSLQICGNLGKTMSEGEKKIESYIDLYDNLMKMMVKFNVSPIILGVEVTETRMLAIRAYIVGVIAVFMGTVIGNFMTDFENIL